MASEHARQDFTHNFTEHTQPLEEIFAKYSTKYNAINPKASFGLSAALAEERLQTDGPNDIREPPQPSLVVQFLGMFVNPFNIILLVCATLSLTLYFVEMSVHEDLYLGCILLAVALFNAVFELNQELKSKAVLASFLSLIPARTSVIRDGIVCEISSSACVKGDLIFLKAGQKAPADIRLLQASSDFSVDNSTLTGESEAQSRSATLQSPGVMEAENMVFKASLVVCGDALGVAVRTGADTFLGQIASFTLSKRHLKSELSREIFGFVTILAVIGFCVTLGFLAAALAIGIGLRAVRLAIGLFVAFVPQGLPVTVNTLLTIAAKKLAKSKVLVKNLDGVETLGAITMLATDKTGTLTQNVMTVAEIWYYDLCFNAEAAEQTPPFEMLLHAVALCSRSEIIQTENGDSHANVKISGNATDVGLFRFAAKFIDIPEFRKDHALLHEVPFDSTRKWQLTVNRYTVSSVETSQIKVFLKGAPERVIEKCKFFLENSSKIPTSIEFHQKYNAIYKKLASEGQRLISFAFADLGQIKSAEKDYFDASEFDTESVDFVFIGLVGLLDPPKPEVAQAIKTCQTAGIQVVMVTGDSSLTAEAIARKIGIIKGQTKEQAAQKACVAVEQVSAEAYDACVVNGEMLNEFTDADWNEIFTKRELVFARTTPQQKLAIVTESQKRGHIVGVSGDGINDSPALKAADMGISMNLSASDVSKDAAGMVLLDDRFASIVEGIRQGRIIFDNLRKSARYTITHTMPEVFAFLIFVILRIPPPISAILVIYIDLGTELAPAMSFAWDLPETDVMQYAPRKVARVSPTSQRSGMRGVCANFFAKFHQLFGTASQGHTIVDRDTVLWCYFQGGLIEAATGMCAYLTVLAMSKVDIGRLVGAGKVYFNAKSPPLTLTSGRSINAAAQMRILARANSAYYLAIVIVQWFNLFLTKHRFRYPWGRDMFANHHTYWALLISASVAALIVYTPGIQYIVKSAAVPIYALFVCVAGGVCLVAYEVARRFLHHKGFLGGVPQKYQGS